MPLAYEIHPTNRVLVYVATGSLTAGDVLQTMSNASQDEAYDPAYSVVMVADDSLQTHELDSGHVRTITSAGIGMLGRGDLDQPSYQAVIAPDGVHELFGKFFAAIVESNPDARAVHKICKTLDETEQWTGCRLEGIEAIELGLRGDYGRIREIYGKET
jgi:hypothetical protein